jgi:PPE-repeat protein
METFKQFKEEFIRRAKEKKACETEFKRILVCETIQELIIVIKDNLNWIKENNILDSEFVKIYDDLFNTGKENTGLFNGGDQNSGDLNSGNLNSGDLNSGYLNGGDRNSGDLNSGDQNSGDQNSGYRNSGDQNSGDQNSGDQNSGYRNSGDLNSGDLNSGDQNSGYLNSGDRNSGDQNSGNQNSGYRNSGDRNSGGLNSGDQNSGYLNSGYRNSGDLNSGDQNSGYRNSGYRNSGDLNSGDRNSGIFCNKKREDKVIVFNKESDMTWDKWYNHPVYDITLNLVITEWINWDCLSESCKKGNPKTFVTGGLLKVYDYKEAWQTLWNSLSDKQKSLFKSLPNFDAVVFEDITGIHV